MNKKIAIKMLGNKNIEISRDEQPIVTILQDNRSIGADEIFELFDYCVGDTFEITKENKQNLDETVLDYFYDLIKDISEQIVNYKDDEDVLSAYKVDSDAATNNMIE